MKYRRPLLLITVVVLTAAACGGSDDAVEDTTTTTSAATTTTAAAETTTTTTSEAPADTTGGAASDLVAARNAVVQIEAKGTFVDPVEGQQTNVPGSGSGFIIDPAGLAVTNNHVVTGAALLQVHVEGAGDPLNAKVVAVSECSDLAVIDIDGDGFPYLDWYDGETVPGLAIFAAGYPLGDPEYTLLEGIVSKEDAGGETNWASVDRVIEHSADTLPGNSGGPILTDAGRVVAVNYAGNSAGQSFAIGLEVALPVVERLLAGEDVDSIGINGEAFVLPDASGIWVYSVESGSPADVAGIRAGDIVTGLEGLAMATDGTMADYCDVLRSHDPTDTLSLEVYRLESDELLEGQLNGRPLEAVFSFAAEIEEQVEAPVVADDPAVTYTEYVPITDDSGSIMVQVPAEWADVNGVFWSYEGNEVGVAVSAAPSLQGFIETWGTPGMFVSASATLPFTVPELLEQQDFSGSCTLTERIDYDDGFYAGQFDLWTECGDEGSTFIVLAANPVDGREFIVLVQILAITEADLDAADQILATFDIVGEL